MSAERSKRRRIEQDPSSEYKLDDDENNYEPYIPVAQRRQAKLAALASRGLSQRQKQAIQQIESEHPDVSDEETQRERERKERTLLLEAQEVHRRKAAEGSSCPETHITGTTMKHYFVQMHRKRKLSGMKKQTLLFSRLWPAERS